MVISIGFLQSHNLSVSFAYSKEMKYKSSIAQMEFLDIAEDDSIMEVEILNISSKFCSTKYDTKNYNSLNIHMNISKDTNKIKITFTLLKRKALTLHMMQVSVLNKF
jgi:hypothetical protein